MTTRRKMIGACFAALAGIVCLQVPPAGADSNEPLAVVVSKDSNVKEMSLYQLKRLYMGDAMDMPGGGRFLALNRGPKTAERVGFDKTVLGMDPAEVARYWIDRKIRGQSSAPKAVDPASVVQKVVGRLAGAVSYVRLHQVSPDVRVIRVDGKNPGDPGYPIMADGGGSRSQADSRRAWYLF